jgi:hypothetical protein
MTRTIVHVLLAGALLAGTSCKKKEGDSGSSSGTTAADKTESPPAAAKTTGIPECDTYVKAMEKFTTCDKLPPEQKKAYAGALDRDRQSFTDAKDKAATAQQCKQAMTDLAAGAKERNCPLE